VADTGLEPVT